MTKIFDFERLAEQLDKHRNNTIVLCHGVFDLLHLGHIRYFEEAKAMGDILVVTLTPDEFVNKGPHRPAFTSEQRAEAIAALSVVDFVSVNKWPTAIEAITQLRPNLYVKGADYKHQDDDITGNIKLEEKAIHQVGGDIRYTNNITFSSSKLLNRQGDLFTTEQAAFIKTLRDNYKTDDIRDYLYQLKTLRVLLVGEIIIDEYVCCTTLGKAGKEPILTLRRNATERYAGGILAIANHIADFVNEVVVLSYLGDELTSETFCKSSLADNVTLEFITKSHSPTLTKRRYLDSEKGTKIIGVYDINDNDLNEQEDQLFCTLLNRHLGQHDITIVADYGHGLISNKAVDLMRHKSNYLAVNTQLNSANLGFHTISKYSSAHYVCMHEGELRHDFRCKNRSLEQLAMSLYKRIKSNVVTITKGAKGAITYREKEGFTHSPAFANRVVDKIGAGDALFAITSLCNTINMPADISMFLGNLAGAEAVANMGNSKSISLNGMLKSVESMLK